MPRLTVPGLSLSWDYQKTLDLTLRDIEDIEICCITPDVVARTIKCLENSPLRAMVHSIWAAPCSWLDLFVSSGCRQIEAARREEMNVMET